MSAYNCLKAKVKSGVIPKHKGKAASDRIKEIRESLIKHGEDPFIAQQMADAQYAKELKFKAVNAKWRLINNVRVSRALKAKVDATAVKDLGKMARKMMDDIDFEARAEHKRIMGRLGSFLEKHRVNIMNNVSNPMDFTEFMRALKGEPTNNQTAKAMAAAVNETNEWIRKKLNSYGLSIGKLDDWGLPHHHNALAIHGVSFRQWFNDTDARLDWAGMINPKTGLEFGAVPSQAFREEFLTEARANILYGRNSKNPQWGMKKGNGGAARHRTLKFKSADDWIAYNNKYGSADPHSTLLQHWDQMSREIALARRLGAEPESALEYLDGLVAQKNREADSGYISAKKGEGGVVHAQRMLRVMQGGIGPQSWAGAQSARFFSTTRKLLTSALLDRAVVISVPSDMNSMRLASEALRMNPAGWFPTYMGLLKDAAKGGGMTRQDLLRAQHVAESWANPGVTLARVQSEFPAAAWAEKLSNASMRIQGMNAHTDSAKLSFAWSMSGHMASISDKPFNSLHPYMQKAMGDAGITPADWDIFRTGPKFKASNGAEFLDPIYWQTASTIDPVEADRVFLTFQSFVEKWTEMAVPSRSLMVQGVLDPRAYGLAPGSPLFEAMKSAGMFKSFVGAFVINQARMLGHMSSPGAKAGYIANMLGSTMVVGALGIQVNELLFGRDPQEMDTDFLWRSVLKGGGLGPAGDLLFQGTTTWGGGWGDYLAGPVAKVAYDATKVSFGNVVQAYNQAIDGDDIDLDLMKEIIDFQRRYTPMWQTPAALGGVALDRILSDQMVLLFDPGALEDMAKATKRRDDRVGGGTAWMPGSPLPGRLPDLSRANPF